MKSTAAGLIYKLGANGKMKNKLSDICTYRNGKVDIKDLNAETYISTENMLPNKGGITEAASLPTVHLTQEYKKDDVLVSNIRPYFKKIWRAKNDGGCSNDVLVFQANENIDKGFLYYVLANDDFFAYSMATSKGTKMPRGDKFSIMRYEVPNFDLKTQSRIVAVLSALDDKIELNNKINENLEQQAQAIFKSWFVDFEPFGGVMPQDWKVGKLSEILKLKKHSIQPNADESLPYLPIDLIPIKSLAIKEVRPNKEALSSLLRFDENDILIGAMRVYFHGVAIAPFNGITRTTCFILEPFNPKYLAYGLITCNQDLTIDYAQKTSKGSTMPYAVWEGGLGDFEIPIPDEKTTDKFNKIIKPLFEQIKKSFFENKYLQEIRDSLLPKLMNGEIDVSEVKI